MTRRNEGVAAWHTGVHWGSRWGDSAYERGADARRKFWIKPLKETDLGEAQAFFDPYKRPKKYAYQMIPKAKIYTPKRDDEHPHPFHMPRSPPPPRAWDPHDNRHCVLCMTCLSVLDFLCQCTGCLNTMSYGIGWFFLERIIHKRHT